MIEQQKEDYPDFSLNNNQFEKEKERLEKLSKKNLIKELEDANSMIKDMFKIIHNLKMELLNYEEAWCSCFASKNITHDKIVITQVAMAQKFAATGKMDGLSKLMEAGFDINQPNFEGRTALHVAVCANQIIAVKFLIRNGASMHNKDRWGSSPLDDSINLRRYYITQFFEMKSFQQSLKNLEHDYNHLSLYIPKGLESKKENNSTSKEKLPQFMEIQDSRVGKDCESYFSSHTSKGVIGNLKLQNGNNGNNYMNISPENSYHSLYSNINLVNLKDKENIQLFNKKIHVNKSFESSHKSPPIFTDSKNPYSDKNASSSSNIIEASRNRIVQVPHINLMNIPEDTTNTPLTAPSSTRVHNTASTYYSRLSTRTEYFSQKNNSSGLSDTFNKNYGHKTGEFKKIRSGTGVMQKLTPQISPTSLGASDDNSNITSETSQYTGFSKKYYNLSSDIYSKLEQKGVKQDRKKTKFRKILNDIWSFKNSNSTLEYYNPKELYEQKKKNDLDFAQLRGSCLVLNCKCDGYKRKDSELKICKCGHFLTTHEILGDTSLLEGLGNFIRFNEKNIVVPIDPTTGEWPKELNQNVHPTVDISYFFEHENKEWIIPASKIIFKKQIGRGSQSVVYLGEFESKEVAIKIINLKTNQKRSIEKIKSEILEEFGIMAALKSDYIVSFYGVVITPALCLVLEYCANGCLYDVILDDNLNFSWLTLLKWFESIIKGTLALHDWDPPIVHRDLKSLNILLDSTNNVKLADFGLSRFIQTESNQTTLGKLRGTYAYAAPEVYFGEIYSLKSDVYSLAIILWEMVYRILNGKYQRPYEEYALIKFDFQIIIQVAQKGIRPTIPAACPPSIKSLIESMWKFIAQERPDCDELLDSIQNIREEYLKNQESWDLLVRKVIAESD